MAEFKPGVNPLFLREEELRRGMEMLFYASRDLAVRTDAALAEHGLGRAHQRSLYFVGQHPGLIVSDLLALLGITKQSLSRVLKKLVADGYLEQRAGTRDRRQRRLFLTDTGRALDDRLTALQRALVARAYRSAGAEAVEGFRKVLDGLIAGPRGTGGPIGGGGGR